MPPQPRGPAPRHRLLPTAPPAGNAAASGRPRLLSRSAPMTQATGPAPGKSHAADGLTGPAGQVHLAVLAAFTAAGQPPARSDLVRLARAASTDPDAVLAELEEADLIAFATDGQIRAAYPL